MVNSVAASAEIPNARYVLKKHVFVRNPSPEKHLEAKDVDIPVMNVKPHIDAIMTGIIEDGGVYAERATVNVSMPAAKPAKALTRDFVTQHEKNHERFLGIHKSRMPSTRKEVSTQR